MADVFKINITNEELQFRKHLFGISANDYSKIFNFECKCTICCVDINWMFWFKKQVLIHPVLEVLVCEACFVSLSSTNNLLEYCLWCGRQNQQEQQYTCTVQRCPAKFCTSCVRQNFGNSGYQLMMLQDKWICFLCDSERLWVSRAVCAAAQKLAEDLRNSDNEDQQDYSIDCAICMSTFETVKKLSCNHKFHKKCLDSWIQKNRSCPICRSIYVEGKTL